MKAYELDSIELDKILTKKYVSKTQSCQQRGLKFEINYTTFKNMMRAKRCYYTGVELTLGKDAAQSPTDVTIERIDPSKDYVNSNCVAVCYAANTFKSAIDNPQSILKPEHFFKMAKEWQKRLK